MNDAAAIRKPRAIVGQGAYRYEIIDDWARLPEGWVLQEVAGIGTDAEDNVFLFTRGTHPVIKLDRDGTVLDSWGQGLFVRPHGLQMAPDGTIFLTDEQDHTVRQFTTDGRLLMQVGQSRTPAPFMSGKPFCRCCDVAFAPNGDFFVADGYANARVHRYSADGKLLLSWGECGSGPGQFNVVHDICCDADGWVYVADRENHRIQVFDGNGRYETQWNNLHRPCALFMPKGCQHCLVGELGPGMPVNRHMPNIGPRISVLDRTGRRVARLGNPAGWGMEPDRFMAPHGLAMDSHGDLYVGEVSWTNWPNFHPDAPRPDGLRALHKLRRI